MIIEFTIPGPPVGYYAVGKMPNWKRMNAYHDYKKHVRACARVNDISLPLQAGKDSPLMIRTVAYFKNGIHPDPGNVQKGVVDALFWAPRGQKRGSDKYTGGSFPPPLYDSDNPRVEVRIERLGQQSLPEAV